MAQEEIQINRKSKVIILIFLLLLILSAYLTYQRTINERDFGIIIEENI